MPAPRNTKQKDLVRQALRDARGGHITADGLSERLRAAGTPVPRSTVYRCLTALEASGDARRYTIPDAPSACYQLVGDREGCRAHYHLMCRACGQLAHFGSRALEEALAGLPAQAGVRPDMEKTLFYGLCGDCLTEETP